jgi:hypothetical protein
MSACLPFQCPSSAGAEAENLVARRLILRASMPAGVLAFWVCMLVAAAHFPSEYDWRYMTTSQLIYPERNPAGHLWASAALIACAAGGLMWLSALPRTARLRGLPLLAAGYGCMILSSLLPERWLSIRDGHEALAIAGFVGVCAGLVLLSVHHLASRSQRHAPRAWLIALAGLAFSPIAMAGITQIYLTWWRPDLPWVGLTWKAMGVSPALSFALWEWITCAVLSAYMTAIGLAVGEHLCRTSNC